MASRRLPSMHAAPRTATMSGANRPEQSRSIGDQARRPSPSACRLAEPARTAKPSSHRARSAGSCPRCLPARRERSRSRSPAPELIPGRVPGQLASRHRSRRSRQGRCRRQAGTAPLASRFCQSAVGSGKAQLAIRNTGPRLAGGAGQPEAIQSGARRGPR